jgi:RNA polymerase sigma factor FliA
MFVLETIPMGGRIRSTASHFFTQPKRTEADSHLNDLILDHLPTVNAIAARFRLRLPWRLEFDDLMQAGIMGLLEAARKYDPKADCSFSTYAAHRIKGAIFDSLRVQDPGTRKLRRDHREVECIRAKVTQELQRDPTEAELANRAGVEPDRLREVYRDVAILKSMNEFGSGGRLAQFPAAQAQFEQPDARLQRQARTRILREVIGKLPEADRAIVNLHYEGDFSLRQIGAKFGVPEKQVSRRHQKALQRMGGMLAARGITAASGF